MKKPAIDYKILGSLLEQYRKEKGISRNNLVKLSNEYFSYATLRRIEEGEYASLNNYIKVSKLLGFELSNDNDDYVQLKLLIEETYEIINSGKYLSEYVLLKNKIRNFEKRYHNYIYISDISNLCICSLEMYLSYKKPSEEIIKVSEHCYTNGKNKKIKNLAYVLLFMYAIYYLRGNIFFDKYIKYYKMIDDKRLLILNSFFYDFNINDILSTYSNYCAIDRYDNESIINSFIFNFANAYTNAYVQNYHKALQYIELALSIKDIQLVIPKGLIMHAYISKGYIEYNLRQYKESYNCFLKVYETNSTALEIAYVFLFKTAELTNNFKTINKILKNKHQSSATIKDIFNYYQNKHINKLSEKELAKYIVDNFSIEKCKSKILSQFFLNELFTITKTTKLYKLYFDFVELNNSQTISINKDLLID